MSKGIFWLDPNDNIQILEPTEDACKEFHTHTSFDMIRLSSEHIQSLLDGKMLAWHDSEYTTFVIKEGVA